MSVRAMEMVDYPFLACNDNWEILGSNEAAKKVFPKSLTKYFSAEVLTTLRNMPDNVVRISGVQGSDQLYSIRLLKNNTPDADTGATMLFTAKPVPASVIPEVFTSTFLPENALTSKMSMNDVNFAGKKVVIRVDFNVPMAKDGSGKITNDFRMRSTLPTITKALQGGAKVVVLMSHLGRPKGKGFEEKFTLKSVAAHLQTLVPSTTVHFAPDCMNADAVVAGAGQGHIVLLENLRFYAEEGSKDAAKRLTMAKKLASYGDVYVNDAFGTAHRAAASVSEVPRVLGLGVSGTLLNAEIESFLRVLKDPPRPMLAIIGGAKVTDKIKVLKHLCGIVDYLIIGGAMSVPFLKAQGFQIGNSFIEKDKKTGEDVSPVAKALIEFASQKTRVRLLLPEDHMINTEFKDVPGTATSDANVPDGKMALDIGPNTLKKYEDLIASCKTIIWNGPVGVFEMKNYSKGTFSLAKAVAKVTKEAKCVSVVGGGDTVSAVAKAGVQKDISHVSTGGGATLELLEGKALPGLVNLTTKIKPKL
eukprot:PhF_6_TR24846/c0_g1_i1/m.34280/K00927/PGK, pgk; phosphoglycerate kinase